MNTTTRTTNPTSTLKTSLSLTIQITPGAMAALEIASDSAGIGTDEVIQRLVERFAADFRQSNGWLLGAQLDESERRHAALARACEAVPILPFETSETRTATEQAEAMAREHARAAVFAAALGE